jgi:hypothetical protein
VCAGVELTPEGHSPSKEEALGQLVLVPIGQALNFPVLLHSSLLLLGYFTFLSPSESSAFKIFAMCVSVMA